MKFLNQINEFILEKNFKTIYENNKINIINYLEILDLNDNKINLLIPNKHMIITGKKLSVSKLLDKEILIEGNIEKIEFR